MSTVLHLPLEPRELAKLAPAERATIYRKLDLDRVQVEAAEAAIEIVRRREISGVGRRG